MKKRRTSEGKQSNSLQDLGLGHELPTADFSDQPDSGGRIGGMRGVDEYGIEGGVAVEWSARTRYDGSREDAELLDRAQAGAEDIEEFSEEGEEESEAIAEALEEDGEVPHEVEELPRDLLSLIEYRLRHHDRIDARNVSVLMDSPGLVVLRGRVRSVSESLRVSEIVSALPGVYAVRNLLVVPR